MPQEIELLSKARQTKSERSLIYFVCGNPGLIQYYDAFLGCLSTLTSHLPYDIYGRNLLGFADDEHSPFSSSNQPFDLEAQVQAVMQDVKVKGREYAGVILMGHSVGAYISVEVMSRLRKEGEENVNVRHGVLLFPTLEWIGKSPSGKRMALLRRVPGLDDYGHILAGCALWCLSLGVITWIVGSVLGFNENAAAVTARWLKSKDGVWQAIHLGQSEMATICEDKWEEELWGLVKGNSDTEVPRFFLFYGREDHWVDGKLRDEFVRRRGVGGTRVEVDRGDMPHAFCVRDETSLEIARKVAGWVEEMEGGR